MKADTNLHKPLSWRLSPAERKTALLIGDIAATLASLLLAIYIWDIKDTWMTISWAFIQQRIPFWYFLLPVFWLLMLTGLYDLRRASSFDETLKGIGIAAGISLGLYLLVFFLSEPNSLPRLGVAIFMISASLLTFLWRLIYIQVFTAPLFMRRVLIVGAGRAGSTLVKIVDDINPPPFSLIGLIDDDKKKKGKQIGNHPVLGGSDIIVDTIKKQNITDLVFSISGEIDNQTFEALINAEEMGIQVTTMPVIYEELLGRVPIFLHKSDWILRSFLDEVHAAQSYETLKRAVDILGGIVGIIIFLLLLPVMALGIVLTSGFPVFYSQIRLGKNGKEYRILKFRTMHQDAEKDGKAIPASENDERITAIGRILRKSHLDEFPQFINVLRGEMSLVGPRSERPELVSKLQQEIPFYRARLLVRPGLTGWAQINYGYAASIAANATKLEYDLYYIKHRNLMLDASIVLRTFGAVIGFKGR